MKTIAKVSFVIIGSLIGAGFASGKEIYTFFGSYGLQAIAGIILSTVLTGIIIAKVLQLLKNHSISNYQDFLECITRKKRDSLVTRILNIIIKIFLLISFYVMVSGFSSYFHQEFGIPILIGSSIMALFSFFIFSKDIQGVVKANTFLVPILMVLILLLGFKTVTPNIVEKIQAMEIPHITNWITSAILYSSYNSILLIPILIPLKKYIQKRNHILGISLFCTIVIGIMSLCMLSLLTKIDISISSIEMPIIYVANLLGKVYPYFYGFVIVSAIFTSAICTGYSFLENGKENVKTYFWKNVFVCGSSIFVSHLGFSNLVNALYPVFGYLGLLQIFFLFFGFSIEKNRKN